ncbi:MAG: threonine synthase, partial [Chloroflexi bacterium]|nr:threonine synthase [Chloroflexota bacterium]
MSFATGLRCRKCGQEYPLQPLKVCDFCLSPVEVNYDYKAMSKAVSRDSIAAGPTTIWRYRDLLPVETKHELK